jgi:hypothetical protein
VGSSFFIFAGFVFITASELYLKAEFGADYLFDAPVSLLHKLTMCTARSKGEQVSTISTFTIFRTLNTFSTFTIFSTLSTFRLPAAQAHHVHRTLQGGVDQYR